MTLLKRIMWPRAGEEVAILQNGKLFVEGHVIYSGDDSITVMGRNAVTATVTSKELSAGIDDGSIVVKKKNAGGWVGQDK
ncbi:MAG: hypothetical protein ABI690_28240 [Chloroflexota bacterium]